MGVLHRRGAYLAVLLCCSVAPSGSTFRAVSTPPSHGAALSSAAAVCDAVATVAPAARTPSGSMRNSLPLAMTVGLAHPRSACWFSRS